MNNNQSKIPSNKLTDTLSLQIFHPIISQASQKRRNNQNNQYKNAFIKPVNIVKNVKSMKQIPKQILNAQKTDSQTKTDIQSINDLNLTGVIRHVLKSNYQKLINQYQGTNKLFTDPDFPPTGQSLGGRWINHTNFKRISEVFPNPVFVNQKIQPSDILQGQIGDCYFLSALASLAQFDYRIKNIFPSLEIQKNGIYMARVLHRGILHQVVVDDYIPVNVLNQPLFAKASGGNQIWVIILQKCWAKLHKSYAVISGGLPHEVLHAFSGAPTFYNSMPKTKQDQDALFNIIYQADQQGAVLCCGTKSDLQIQKKGLVVGHAYTLLAVYEHPYKMVKVRNPWGSRQWNGRASQNDVQFWNSISQEDKRKFGLQKKDDGTFFMLWDDFIQVFNMVDICMIEDHANYLCVSNGFIPEQGAMFQLKVQTPGKVVVNVSQDNIRTFKTDIQKKRGYAKTTIIFSKYNQLKKGYQYSFSKASQFSMLPDHYMVFDNMQPGKYVFFIECDWFDNQRKQATVSAYSSSRIQLKKRQDIESQFYLYEVFMDHARRNSKKKQFFNAQQTQWKCEQFLLSKCDYGYATYHLDQTSNSKLGIQINQNEYNSRNMRLLKPYKGNGKMKMAVYPGQQLIVLFKLDPYKTSASFTVPLPRVYKLSN